MVMKFIEKIRKLTKEANDIEYVYPNITKTIIEAASKGKNWCSVNSLTPIEIEALRAEGFQVSEAAFLFEHYIEW